MAVPMTYIYIYPELYTFVGCPCADDADAVAQRGSAGVHGRVRLRGARVRPAGRHVPRACGTPHAQQGVRRTSKYNYTLATGLGKKRERNFRLKKLDSFFEKRKRKETVLKKKRKKRNFMLLQEKLIVSLSFNFRFF